MKNKNLLVSERSITDTQTTNRHEIEEYLMSLQPNDVRIVSGEMSLEDIELGATENNFTGDGSFDTDMVIETPKYKIGLLLSAHASGGSDYGFVDAEVDIEFAITGYTDKATNQQFKVNYNTTPYIRSKYRNFDSHMLELIGLY
jgi:hypothetical protein